MKNDPHSERVDAKKLDAKTIQRISNDITRILTEAATEDPNMKIHIRLGHGRICEYVKSGFTKIIIEDEDGSRTGLNTTLQSLYFEGERP